MANTEPYNWYQVLVDQSKNDRIYDLIHNNIPGDLCTGDEAGFVVIDPRDMPGNPTTIPMRHLAKTMTDFNEGGLMLLKNNCLGIYLEAATSMAVYEGTEHHYILLSFKPAEPRYYDDEDEDEDDDQLPGIIIDPNNPEEIFDEEDSLMHCWALITKCRHKQLALELAVKGHDFLDKKRLTSTDAEGRVRTAIGYNIVSVAYAWNNCFDDAAITDSYYINNPELYPHMAEAIAPYIEMLIAKKQAAYLEHLFKNEALKQCFLPHYEAYISLLVNPNYECSRMRDMVPIINRVNNGLKQYL
jgi:hypothetical protein